MLISHLRRSLAAALLLTITTAFSACSGGSSTGSPAVTPLTDSVETMSVPRKSHSISAVEGELQSLINEANNEAAKHLSEVPFYGAEATLYNEALSALYEGHSVGYAIQSACSENYLQTLRQITLNG